jgi:hypothetical protein
VREAFGTPSAPATLKRSHIGQVDDSRKAPATCEKLAGASLDKRKVDPCQELEQSSCRPHDSMIWPLAVAERNFEKNQLTSPSDFFYVGFRACRPIVCRVV